MTRPSNGKATLNTQQVLLAVKPPMLRDALRAVLQHERDLEIITEPDDPLRILLSVVRLKPDVLVQTWPSDVMPGSCTNILAENPFLRVIGISTDCRQINVCEQKIISRRLPVASLSHLLEAICHESTTAKV